MYIYLFPFGFQYTFITLPQLGHFSDTIIQPEPVSPMSQARFLHRLSGHFIFRIIPPPFPQYICCYLPARIWNKGTSLVLLIPFLPIRLFVPTDYLHFTPLIFIQEMNIPLSIKSKIKDTSFWGALYFGPLIIT